jgi:hypothetical protein
VLENEVPPNTNFDDWSDELKQKCDDWCGTEPVSKYCKDCGMDLKEVSTYDGESEIDDWGHVITPNNHPCNPDSPIFE